MGNRRRLARSRGLKSGHLSEPSARLLSFQRCGFGYERSVVGQNCHRGVHDTAGLLPDRMVPFAMRDPLFGSGCRAVSASAAAVGTTIRHATGRAGEREDTHRAGVARYSAAKFSWIVAAVSDGI